uniref:Uncharacterized protein n=1 Tax=Falco tinnunculus TaxID=100819 RepID=A0A8C4UA98_FALTI
MLGWGLCKARRRATEINGQINIEAPQGLTSTYSGCYPSMASSLNIWKASCSEMASRRVKERWLPSRHETPSCSRAPAPATTGCLYLTTNILVQTSHGSHLVLAKFAVRAGDDQER